MDNKTFKALSTETKKFWGITKQTGFSYDPQGFWLSLEKRMNDLPLSDDELQNYMRAFIICTVLEINLKWPQKEKEGKNNFQESILSIVVADLMEFYERDPQKYLFNYITTIPTTDAEKRHLHRHIKGKARKQIFTALSEVQKEERDPALKPRKVKKVKDDRWPDTSEDEYTKPESFSINAEIKHEDGESLFELPDERYLADLEITDYDEVILAAQSSELNSGYDKVELKIEVQNFFNDFYLNNRNQVNNIIPYFQNISFYRIRTKDIWTTNKLDWKTEEVWNLLNKIDQKLKLSQFEKGTLYHFYLIVCIVAMKNKDDKSVLSPTADGSQRILISKPIADILYILIVKTFLYFTFDLGKKVFSRVIDPPPVSDSDVKKFNSAIKDKPSSLSDFTPF